jgi:hypothetical protein
LSIGINNATAAETFSEIKQVKGVFLFEGFQHWLNLAYDYSGSDSSNSSNTGHAFKESYNFSLQTALFDPLIFDAFLQGSLVFNQSRNKNNTSSYSGNDTSYQYNLSGSGLSKSRIPFTLLSFRTIETVQNTYTPPTTTDNSTNEFTMTFLNSALQSKFQYTRNDVSSKSGGSSSNSLSNSFSYSAEHQYKDVATTLSTSFSDQSGSSSSGDTLTSSSNSISLSNSLSWGARNNYSLLSTFQLNNSMVDNFPFRSISYSEGFGASFGRALSLNATYSLTNTRSTDYYGLDQQRTINQGDVRLKHKLFESLYTELSGRALLNKQNDGNDNTYSLQGSATYLKNISESSRLSIRAIKGYELVDRRLSTDTTVIRDQLHSGIHQRDTINLFLSDGILRSVKITSRNPIATYAEDVDYTVNYPLGRITILPGGNIDTAGIGADVYITYTVYKDPKLTYATNSLSLASDLSLFDGELTVGTAWDESTRNLINGPETNSLQDSRSLLLYVSGNRDNYTGRLSYRNEVAGVLTTQSFEASGTANWQTANSLISLVARDAYSIFDSTTSASYKENTADVTLSYSRSIMSNARLTMQGNAVDLRSELRPTKDTLSLQAKVVIVLNMVTINMTGQTILVIEPNNTTRNDSIHIDLTRYF